MNTQIVLIICCTLLGFCFSLMVMALKKKQPTGTRSSQLDQQRLKRLEKKLSLALASDGQFAPGSGFKKTLDQATLHTSLQAPRLLNQARIHQPPPEKYTILSKLLAQGMPREEIASILRISTVEADQLIKLHSMANIGPSV